ncbi:MAG: type I-G CRISPR-associated RAMP protein Csb1/Cas7g [Deltaproteobacteria bacterium]
MPSRDLFEVHLRPASGSRFQPTGFPDLGAARFRRPIGDDDWEDALLVESPQSMANHLEATAWERGLQQPAEAVAGLPYVRVVDAKGEYLTSSRTEAHRLSSAFVKDSFCDGEPMRDVIRQRLGLRGDAPLAPREVARAIFALDPFCLVHGVFFADKSWPGQPKVARALTGFVEAHDVETAVSGGVKRDDVRHSVGEGAGGAAEGYGFVPFHRTEYVAREIVASFNIDLDQIASYGLPAAAAELLETLARWEVRRLLDAGFRPRTACDLVPCDAEAVDGHLPDLDSLSARLSGLVPQCAELVGSDIPLQVVWDGDGKKRPRPKAAAEGDS